MKRSSDRILTSHVGSLIRPPELIEFLRAQQERRPFDEAAFAKCLSHAVADIVRQQAEVGIDVVDDGEFGKTISWSQYALERLSGFERRPLSGGVNPFARGADRTQALRRLEGGNHQETGSERRDVLFAGHRRQGQGRRRQGSRQLRRRHQEHRLQPDGSVRKQACCGEEVGVAPAADSERSAR